MGVVPYVRNHKMRQLKHCSPVFTLEDWGCTHVCKLLQHDQTLPILLPTPVLTKINLESSHSYSIVTELLRFAHCLQAALGERVRVYEDLVNDLKANLEQMGNFDDELDDCELADLEESLSGQSINSTSVSGTTGESLAELHTMSLVTDTSHGVQDDSPDKFFEGLIYESADELRVAIKGLKVMHAIALMNSHINTKSNAEQIWTRETGVLYHVVDLAPMFHPAPTPRASRGGPTPHRLR